TMLFEKGFERRGVLADVPQAGDELAAAGAEQPDRAVGLVIDADDAAEPLLAAAAGAILGRELRPELREGDAVLLLEPGIAGGFGAAGGLLGAPFRISGVFERPEVPAALFASLAEFRVFSIALVEISAPVAGIFHLRSPVGAWVSKRSPSPRRGS